MNNGRRNATAKHAYGCTCAGCQKINDSPPSLYAHWRDRRQQRLEPYRGKRKPACGCPSCRQKTEQEFNDDDPSHNYWRRRRQLRYGWDFDDLEQETSNEGPFSPLVQAFLKGQQQVKFQLALLRRQLNLPPVGTETNKKYTLAKLSIGPRIYYGINAHGTPSFLVVNPISRTHAEGDVFNQAKKDGLNDTSATLFVDRPMCTACGTKGAVTSMARQIGLKKLVIIEPGSTAVLNL